MGNPVLIGAKLNFKRSALQTIEERLNGLLAKRSEIEATIEVTENEEDLVSIEESIKANDEEIAAVEQEKSTLDQVIKDLEAELERSNKNIPAARSQTGGKETMDQEKMTETRSAINEYVRSKGALQERAGFTSVEGGALIPEVLLAPVKAIQDVVDLTKYVNVVSVNGPSGKYPVISKSGSKMYSVDELEKNPELAKPTITQVAFDVKTFRGYIPVSQEVIDDADYDITGLIAEEIRDQERNTKNHAISELFKAATAKDVKGLDGIITLLNTGFKTAYNVKVYVSTSLFNELDLLKDKNGRYLLQDDITVASGKRIKGREIVVLDDTIIGVAGELKGFVGDAKEFVTLFDRKRASVKWIDNNVYGQMLAGFVRFGAEKVDPEAGYYITFTPDPKDNTGAATPAPAASSEPAGA